VKLINRLLDAPPMGKVLAWLLAGQSTRYASPARISVRPFSFTVALPSSLGRTNIKS
jgi:hypothetical protein